MWMNLFPLNQKDQFSLKYRVKTETREKKLKVRLYLNLMITIIK